MAAPIRSALKHIARPTSRDAVRTPVQQTVINANVDANRNTIFGRIFDDEKGLGGGEHMRKVQDRNAIRRKDKEIYNDAMNQHRESLSNLNDLKQKAQVGGESAETLAKFDRGIKQTEEAMRNTKRKTSAVDSAWENTADTFRAMNSGTAAQIATKWGAVAAAGVAVNGAGRVLTGGGVSHNASGQRDIMGIPFV